MMPQSLTWRVVLLMSLAMLPLGLIAMYQTRAVVEEARIQTHRLLLTETLDAATEVREVIQLAMGASYGLATNVSRLDHAQCAAAMAEFVDGHDLYIFAGFVARDGVMACQSHGAALDLSDNPDFLRAIENERPVVRALARGSVSRQPVIVTVQPVHHGGKLAGLVVISIPLWIAKTLIQGPEAERGLKLAALNLEGEVIAVSPGAEAIDTVLPRDVAPESLAALQQQVFEGVAIDGSARSFAVAPLIEDAVVLVGSWPASGPRGEQSNLVATTAIAFPALMWIAGVAVAYFGLQRLVVRHIRELRSAMRRFALGERRSEGLVMDGAPEEIAEAQRAFNRMALLISEAETRKEQDLQEKTILLREVHHRVKNNLQIIASIMNIQLRRAQTPEAQHILSGLQRRVRGLAMLHRTLYATTELTTVNAASLVRTVVKDVAELSSQDAAAISEDLDDLPLFPDAAVPVSMILAEAVSNAMTYGGTDADSQPDIRVVLKRLGCNTLVLTVSNLMPAAPGGASETEDDATGRDGLGTWLIAAFVRQLDGEMDQTVEGNRYVLRVSFPLDSDLTST